jgi:uncharacterized membrane protein
MMWQYTSANWFWMFPMMLLVWAGVLAAILLTIRLFSTPQARSDGPLDTLRRRLAAGQITADEFERTKKLLES